MCAGDCGGVCIYLRLAGRRLRYCSRRPTAIDHRHRNIIRSKTKRCRVIETGVLFIVSSWRSGGRCVQTRKRWHSVSIFHRAGWRTLTTHELCHVDHQDRVWVTVSTRVSPREKAYRPDVRDGFIAVVDERGSRMAADGLGYTNECCVSPDGGFLYVNETFGRRLSRFAMRSDGALGRRQTVTEFGNGTYPDGLTFDEQSAVWITSIVSNRVVRVLPDGTQQVILEGSDPQHLHWTEQAFLGNKMGRQHLDRAVSRRLRNISSLAFAGTDRKTIYLGCLLDTVLYRFNTRVAGWKPAHWQFPDAVL
jgi:hypothetical protein